MPSYSSLRQCAGDCGLAAGTAVSTKALRSDPAYRAILAREFNTITCENAMKFARIHPEPGSFTFDDADAIIAFAREHGMAVRGHTLVWHNILPAWFAEGGCTYDAGMERMRGHIQTVVAHYRGTVDTWDVVNEALDDHGGWRDSPYLRMFGTGYLEAAFHWAHEANPQARLFYNDYGADHMNRKSDAMYAMARSLLHRGVPLHGIGMQMHLRAQDPPPPASVAANIKRFNALGLDVQITEMDVRTNMPCDAHALRQQAQIYRDIASVCINASRCSAFIVWGLTDRYSWIPEVFPGEGAALLFDDDGRPKPAYDAIREVLAGKANTRTAR